MVKFMEGFQKWLWEYGIYVVYRSTVICELLNIISYCMSCERVIGEQLGGGGGGGSIYSCDIILDL